MTRYSEAEAKARFSELIDKAEAGQSVVITRHGQPVVEIKQVGAAQPPAPITESDLEALAIRRARRKAKISPVQFLLELRDRGDA
jgi:antitoxin (DNA-binding transcriptional repressor) of toxin-antitoxin stability system